MAAKGDEEVVTRACSSSPPHTSPPAHVVFTGDGGCNNGEGSQRWPELLEDVEMDAAWTLMDFTQMALLEREGCKWGNKGGEGGKDEDLRQVEESEWWSRKRMRSESVAKVVVEKSLQEAEDTRIDASLSPHCQQVRQIERPQRKEVEEGGESRIDSQGGGSTVCKPERSFHNRQRKQNLSTAEREARRQRRVLANRESARQTILRRKVMCEELMKEAAELSRENEKMRMERDEAMKEYLLLRDRNMQLKGQMANSTIMRDVKEDPSRTTSQLQAASAASSSPMHGDPPCPQLAWPPVVKPSLSLDPVPQLCQETGMSSLPKPGFRVPQRPWFLPTPCQPALRAVYSTGYDGGAGPSRGGEHPIGMMWGLTSSSRGESRAEGESSSKSVEAIPKETEHATADMMAFKTSRAGAAAQALVAHTNSAFPTRSPGAGNALGAVATPTPVELQGEPRHPRRAPVLYTSTAAEARRRRRELTKLKHLHGWRGRPRG